MIYTYHIKDRNGHLRFEGTLQECREGKQSDESIVEVAWEMADSEVIVGPNMETFLCQEDVSQKDPKEMSPLGGE